MAVKSSLLSLVFTDLGASTALKMQLGDHKAGELIQRHQERVRALTLETGGREVDTAGDGFFLTFETPSAAVTFALRLQQIHHDKPELPKVRVGVHLGEVSERPAPAGAANPLFIEGLAVDLAGRIQSLAQPGQVLMSQPVFDGARQRLRGQEIEREIRWRSYGLYRIKGIEEPVEIREAGFEGISPLKAPPDSDKATRVRIVGLPRRTALAAGLVLVAAVATWMLWPAPPLAPIRSIAVLPLENLSGDPEQEYFADGMTDAVISEFARIGSLRVISRTSVMQYKKARKPLPEIARELNVQGVVEGSVVRAGDRVRISLQLIDARDDHHLWAESYERDLRDVLALQGQIARSVARAVEAELTPGEERRLRTARVVDPEAHEAYLRGTLHVAEVSVPDAYKAIEYFDRAIERDPEYAEAYLGLAEAYRILGIGLGALPPAEAATRVRAATERALALDDSLARAHASLGDLLHYYEWRWVEAEEALLRAVELSPGDSTVNNRYALYLADVGRHEEALRFHQKAVDADPLHLHWRADKALALLFAHDYERAVEETLQILEVNPRFQFALITLRSAYMKLGRDDDAFDAWIALNQSIGRDEQWLEEFERRYREAGWPGAARYEFTDAIDRWETEYVDPALIAIVSSQTGDAETTFYWLERAYNARSPLLVHLGGFPEFDPLRSDPRFQDLLRRIGFPES